MLSAPLLPAPPQWWAPQLSSVTASTAVKTVATIGATAADLPSVVAASLTARPGAFSER